MQMAMPTPSCRHIIDRACGRPLPASGHLRTATALECGIQRFARAQGYRRRLEQPTQREAQRDVGTSGSSGGDAGVSGGIDADPVTGASVPRDRGNAVPSGPSNK